MHLSPYAFCNESGSDEQLPALAADPWRATSNYIGRDEGTPDALSAQDIATIRTIEEQQVQTSGSNQALSPQSSKQQLLTT